jgi:hypothetical protein
VSISAQNRVWEHSRQDGTNLIALLALADWADADGICWYANDRIAQRVRREERTVTRILNKLRKSGEVFAPPEYGAGRKTLKFVTVGLSEAELVEVLIRRFGMTPIEATAHALKVLKAQAKGKKPVTDDGFKGDKSAQKGVTDDGFIAKKPVTDDGFKPDILREKGDISRKKPDIAMSPDPYDPFDPSVDPEENPPTPQTGRVHVLDKLDPERPFDDRLMAIAEVCGLRENIPKHREWCERAASQLHTFSGDYIRARYGEHSPPDEGWYWYTDDWRGQRGDMPSPPQLVETIAKRKTSARPAPQANGRSRSRAEEAAVEYAQMRQGFFSNGQDTDNS